MNKAEKPEDLVRLQGKLRYLDWKLMQLEQLALESREPENGRSQKTGY